MKSPIFEYIGIDPAYIMGGALLFIIILFILVIILLVKNNKLKKKYNDFMNGKDAKSLEELFTERFQEIDSLKEQNIKNEKVITSISENLKITYQKVGLHKYDAFNEMGGNLSFVLAMLNAENDGFVFNSMHNREGCYTYMKEIINGESYITLSDDEKEALKKAQKGDSLNTNN